MHAELNVHRVDYFRDINYMFCIFLLIQIQIDFSRTLVM